MEREKTRREQESIETQRRAALEYVRAKYNRVAVSVTIPPAIKTRKLAELARLYARGLEYFLTCDELAAAAASI